jgi:hypothetical protein
MEDFDKLLAIYSKIREVNDEPQERDAASLAQVDSAFQAIGLPVNALLARLYAFHNGVYHLDAFLHFLSVEDGSEIYRSFAKFKDEFPDFGWDENWFPVFDMNGDVQVCVDLMSGSVVAIDMEGDTVRVMAPHYSAYVDALHEVFTSGHYCYEPVSGSIEVDEAFWLATAARYGIVGIGDVW